MGMIEQLKGAQELLKGMSADDIKKLMDDAQNSRQILEDTVRRVVAEEMQKKGYVTRDEVRAMIAESHLS